MSNLLTFDEYLINERLNEDFLKKVIFLRFGFSSKGMSGRDDPKSILINDKVADEVFLTYKTDKDIDDDSIKVDTNLPIIYYGGTRDSALAFLKKHKIKKENLYNKPEFIQLSGNKKKFHKLFENAYFIPKTVFSKEDAVNHLTFPIIAKPATGHSGVGIQKFDDRKDLLKSKDEFDTFSEFVDFKKEFRLLFFKDKCINIDERVTNLKTKRDIRSKKKDETLDFVYVKQDMAKVPFLGEIKKIAKIVRAKIPIDVFSLDIVINENNKIFVLETNAATGIGAGKLLKFYIEVYEDFFGSGLPRWFTDKLVKKYNDPWLLINYSKQKKEIASSEWAIDYEELSKKTKKL